jgi:hypothetical protein
VIWEAAGIDQGVAVFPILPIAVLLVVTKPQGDYPGISRASRKDEDVEERGGTDRGEFEVGPGRR